VINVGDEIEIVGIRDTTKTTCTGVEMFRAAGSRWKLATTSAHCCAVLIVKASSAARFCALAVAAAHEVRGEAYILTRRVAVRRCSRELSTVLLRTTDVTGTVNLPEGVEMVSHAR
jgi:elongation factor Tu